MTTVIPDANAYFAGLLAGLRADVNALKTFHTIYVPDAAGATVAIIGDVTHDAAGNATGLSGSGLASKKTGSWIKL